MRRATRIALVGIGVIVVVAFFVSAPIIYSPTTVYGSLVLKTYPTYPNWESLSCSAFGFGVYYGRTFQLVPASNGNGFSGSAGGWTLKYGNATQFGCPPSASVLP
jgi:hypothetical protein